MDGRAKRRKSAGYGQSHQGDVVLDLDETRAHTVSGGNQKVINPLDHVNSVRNTRRRRYSGREQCISVVTSPAEPDVEEISVKEEAIRDTATHDQLGDGPTSAHDAVEKTNERCDDTVIVAENGCENEEGVQDREIPTERGTTGKQHAGWSHGDMITLFPLLSQFGMVAPPSSSPISIPSTSGLSGHMPIINAEGLACMMNQASNSVPPSKLMHNDTQAIFQQHLHLFPPQKDTGDRKDLEKSVQDLSRYKRHLAVPTKSSKAVANSSSGHFTSIYRGVTKHRLTGRYEAHFWDSSYIRPQTGKRGRSKGRQIYLGGFSDEAEAAHAYDKIALVYLGLNAPTNVSQKSCQYISLLFILFALLAYSQMH